MPPHKNLQDGRKLLSGGERAATRPLQKRHYVVERDKRLGAGMYGVDGAILDPYPQRVLADVVACVKQALVDLSDASDLARIHDATSFAL